MLCIIMYYAAKAASLSLRLATVLDGSLQGVTSGTFGILTDISS